MNYYDYIKDKRVCFVGASPILKGKNLGKFIDSFDIVVRTNGSYFLIDDQSFQQDYGKRIDVLYTNNQFYREMFPIPIKDSLKFLRMKTCKPEDLNKYPNASKINHIMQRVNKVNPSSTMGAYIFTDILEGKPKELYITGIDFFASKKKVFEHDNYQEYIPGYLPDKIRKQGNLINIGKTEDGHNFLGNANYIYNLWKSNDNMLFPDFIETILIGIIRGEIKQK